MDAENVPLEYGSDVVAELLGRLGIEYAALNPGATFRGLHDSLVHRQGTAPRIVTCLHEEISVAVAHGYAKAAGRPMTAILHDVVGLQHGCMAIYNAWCDRVPMLLLGGTGPVGADRRRPWIDWIHTALVQGDHVRDFVKWDDQPASVPAAVESIVRGHRLTSTPPHGPVYVCLPIEVQEDPLVAVPPLTGLDRYAPARPGPDPDAIEAAAKMLVDAERPVIVADRAADSPGAFAALAELATLLAAPVVDRGGRMNVSTEHPLDLTGDEEVITDADVVLAVDVLDVAGLLGEPGPGGGAAATSRTGASRAVIAISLADALIGSWTSDYQRLPAVDVPIMSDAGLAQRALIDACRQRLTGRDTARLAARAERVEERHHALRAGWRTRAADERDAQPISVSRIAAEVGAALADRPRMLAHGTLNGWARRLWSWNEPGSYLGTNGGGGIGYGPGASIGAALAARGDGRIIVNLQPDGDLLFTPSALWTMTRESLPILNVVWNNRSYYNSQEHAVRIAKQRGRSLEETHLGMRLDEPAVDFATLGRSFGLYAEGPITEPGDLRPALDRAVRAVLDGGPALVDVVARAR